MKVRALIASVLLFALSARAQDPLPFPKIDFTVKVDEELHKPTGDMVRVLRATGTTAYPPDTALIMEARLKGSGAYLMKKHQVFVNEQQHFEAALDGLGRNVFKGDYEVRITFDPQIQNRPVMAKLGTKVNAGLHSVSVDARLGTKEEEAKEKADVDQVYARSYEVVKKALERVFAEYDKQATEPNRLAWGDFQDDISKVLVDSERSLKMFARDYDNVRDPLIYDNLNRLYALSTSRMFEPLSAALALEGGKGSQQEKESAKQMMGMLKETITFLDGNLGKVAIDPNWKPPKRPVAVKDPDPRPPVVPKDDFTPPPPGEGPKPVGRGYASKFGIVELGIGLAIMCGVAMLVVLLKRK